MVTLRPCSVNTYDCFLDIAPCSLVLSSNRNGESLSNRIVVHSTPWEVDTKVVCPIYRESKKNDRKNGRGQLLSFYFSEMSVCFRCRLRGRLHIAYYTSGNSLLLEIIYVSLVYHNYRMSDFFFHVVGCTFA